MQPHKAPGTPRRRGGTRARPLRWLAFGVIAAATLLAVPRLLPHSAPATPPQPSSAPAEIGGARGAFGQDVGFPSRARLLEHFRKHGPEFGASSPGTYLRLAQQLRDRSPGGDVLEIVRTDGVITRFDRSSGSFLAFEPDGTIRTLFKPNRGEAYFRDQVGEAHR